MKFSLSLVLILLLLAACGGSDPTPTSAPLAPAPTRAINAVAILNTYDFAHNGEDVDAALALFADDAVVSVRSGTFAGPEQIRTWLEREAALNSRTEVVGQRSVQNDTIAWRSRLTRDDLAQLGITDAQADDEAVVQQGKIKSFESAFTPETQAKLAASQGGPTAVPAVSAAQVITGTGATAAELKPTVDAYKQALGGADNDGEPGSKGTGFRTIVWDGLPDNLAAPNVFPSDFFNQPTAPRARGAVLHTPGDGLMVSANISNTTNTLPRFGNINPTYVDSFKAFSEERLFSPVGSNIVELEFFVPGTNIPAVVRGYGAVYTDVDTDHTAFEYFDAAGNSIGVFGTPLSDKGLSFLGVVFPEPVIHRVRIEYGTVELGPDDSLTNDVAVMDDFVYGEPVAIPGAAAQVVTPVPAATSVVSPTQVISGTGATAAELKPTVDAYKQALGGADNDGEPGSKGTGFRTIVWDGLPDNLAAPNVFPSDFFNQPTAPRARGAVLHTPGDGLMVSANISNTTNTLPRFGNIDPTYVDSFKAFSEERLFSPVGSNIVELEFFVPGTNIPAVVRGYGAVYTDVDTDHTAFEYFDAAGNSIGVFGTPLSDKGLSFLGVVFPEPVIHRVRIEYGTVELGPDDSLTNDVAVMDDFVYGEPVAIPGTGAVGAFVQVGHALNRDAASAATEPDLAYGSTAAGSAPAAWATWAEKQGNSQQIFVSRRSGTGFEPVGASLNVHTNVVAERPSIAFAGQDRTVPWVAWHEPSPGFGSNNQIFASRFNSASGLWIAAGQDHGGNEPSLNIHTNKPASNAVIVGGSLDPTQPPVPWVCWQEDSAHNNTVGVYVARAERDESALGGFKWVPTGPNRGGTTQDPEPTVTLDAAHGDGEHCGLAFAGENNVVPWVVWAERSGAKPSRVFAARGVADANAAGGLHWEMVPGCADVSEEAKCILNLDPTRPAEQPQITAGSVVSGQLASPWIVWTEVGPSGKHQVFVNRLDPTSGAKFLNVGGSLNVDQNSNAVSPSITFVGSVPYVAWEEEQGPRKRVFVRHLAGDPQTGTWVLDTPPDGLAADKALDAYVPMIEPSGPGVTVIYRQGDPASSASQIIVCTNVSATSLLPRTAGVAAPLLQAVTCQ